MTPLPAWAKDLVCETGCPLCRQPVVSLLGDILQAQPVRCVCGHHFALAIPPGMPEIAALLVTMESAEGYGSSNRRVRGRMARAS